ncbi:MAG: ATP-binding cassette domain-containing protein, partial [Devosia sp.]
LKPEQTPLEHVIDMMPYDSEAKRRSRIAQMGLTTSRMDTLVKNLSGGERARLLLGLITFGGPGMLILDEPTNHLDIDSRDALVEALNDYTGAVLIISHDRHLIEATVDKLWIAQNGTIEEFDEDLDSYQRMLTSGKDRPQKGAVAAPAPTVDKKAARQDSAARRLEVAPLRKSIKEAEHKLGRLRTELGKVEAILGDPKVYDGAPERVVLLGKDKARFSAEIATTEERWLALSEQLEQAERA